MLRHLNFSTCSVERKSKNVLSTVLSTEHVKKFKKYLNKQHKNISFTSEMEQNGSLSFLDIKINRKNNKFVTSVYRKSTFIGVFTNFESFISNHYKRQSSKAMATLRISSTHGSNIF